MDEDNVSTSGKVLLSTLNIVGAVWNIITFIPWYFMSGNYKKFRLGRVQAKSVTGGPSGPYRKVENLQKLFLGFRGEQTLDRLFKNIVDDWKDKNAFGTREVLSEEDEQQADGKVYKKFILGDYKWLSYNAAYAKVMRISNGLVGLGLKRLERTIIFAETKADWMLSAQACFVRNFPVVTIYATLGEDGLVYGFNETECAYVFTDGHLLPKLLNIVNQLHFVKNIIYYGDAKKSVITQFPSHIQIHSLQQVEEIGSKPENNTPIEPPEAEDLAMIIYTSGSTGNPKGVMMSHRNITSSIAGFAATMDLRGDDLYIGYLPLAHALELIAEFICLANGIPIGYSSPFTLTDTAAKIKTGSKGDISVLKPTLLAAVPMIMDRIRKKVLDKVGQAPPLKQLLILFAYNYKRKQLAGGYDTPLLNKLIFDKVRAILGGKVRAIWSGGAPLSAKTQDFMNVFFCCPVGQGYGLTETVSSGTVAQVWDNSYGRVGCPIGSAEIKLVDWEEGNYTINDKPFPRGEIVIGGPAITMGYFKQEEKTREAYFEENGQRWFYTGDIGEMHADGALKIIDRKKDLVKLQHGEYVSLGKVEAILKLSKYVENCCLFGNSFETYTILLVVPGVAALEELAAEQGVAGQLEDLCGNASLLQVVLKDVQKIGRENGLNKTEIPQKLKLCPLEWTPETGLVTAAFKLKRKSIQTYYDNDIKMLYGN